MQVSSHGTSTAALPLALFITVGLYSVFYFGNKISSNQTFCRFYVVYSMPRKSTLHIRIMQLRFPDAPLPQSLFESTHFCISWIYEACQQVCTFYSVCGRYVICRVGTQLFRQSSKRDKTTQKKIQTVSPMCSEYYAYQSSNDMSRFFGFLFFFSFLFLVELLPTSIRAN